MSVLLPSEGLAIASEQLKNAVLHDGYHDATLESTPPDCATLGAQSGFLALPQDCHMH